LSKIPRHIEEYYNRKGIKPGKPLQSDESEPNIEIEEEAAILKNLDRINAFLSD